MPKNVRCKNCNNLCNHWCEKIIDSPDEEMLRDCQHFSQRTNGDKIRAMTDEELAVLIMCPYGAEDYIPEGGCALDNCYECTLEWLKQSAEDDC